MHTAGGLLSDADKEDDPGFGSGPWDDPDGTILWGEGPGYTDEDGAWISSGRGGLVVPRPHRRVPVVETEEEQLSEVSSSEPAGDNEVEDEDDSEDNGALLVTSPRRSGRKVVRKAGRKAARKVARIKGDEFMYPCWRCVRSAMSGSRSDHEFCNANAADTRSRRCYQCKTHSCHPLHPALREIAREYLLIKSSSGKAVRLIPTSDLFSWLTCCLGCEKALCDGSDDDGVPS